jgi:hypothetical protein
MVEARVPNVDFSWLGQLPQDYEQARGTRERKQSLADLDINNPDSLDQAARRLLSSANMENMAIGIKLSNIAKERKEMQLKQQSALGAQQALLGPAPQGPSAEPRGIRNNNPLNIEAGQFTQRQPGFAGSDGRFAKFEAPEQGLAAADQLLQTYNKQHGINTITGIVRRWAPEADNNPVGPYIMHVSRKLGVPPNQPLNMEDPGVRQQLVQSMAEFENGRPAVKGPTGMAGGMDAAASNRIRLLQSRMLDPYLDTNSKKAIELEITNLQKAAEPTPSRKDFDAIQEERARRGLPPISFEEHVKASRPDRESSIEKEEAKEFVTGYGELAKAGKQATSTRNALNRLSSVANNPEFRSGVGADTLRMAGSFALTLGQVAKDAGISIPGLDKIKNPVKLMEEFTSVSNKTVLDSLGGTLGTQISNTDREFVRQIFPNLGASVEGVKSMILVQDKLAERQEKIAELARTYREEKRRSGGRPVKDELDSIIADFAEKNRLFTPEEEGIINAGAAPAQETGNSILDTIRGVGRGGGPAPQRASPGGNEGRSVIGPDGARYIFRGGQLVPAGNSL